jgi:methylenetetrahydrofolate dehydrogenase (NADP+) / methenyltetrahydrofolate cyclohydrolase
MIEYTINKFMEAEMAPLILEGKSLAKKIEIELKERVDRIINTTNQTPILATILVGSNPASETYVNMKGNACRRVGIAPLKIQLPETTTTDELLEEIDKLNKNDMVHGILLQHPVPSQIDEQKCFNSILVEKDVDGVNTDTFGKMTMGLWSFKSATPLSIMTIIEHYDIEIEGKEVVVVGRSPILGKPVAMMMLNKNATVTVCHSKTKNLPEIVRRADIVIAAVGKPNFIKAEWVKDGVVLIDAGYNEGNVGDIDLENAKIKSVAYTPVPGGVGPMTISSLIRQTIEAAEMKCGIK